MLWLWNAAPDQAMEHHNTEILQGTPERFRDEAALLYDAAFGAKFAVAIPSRERRLRLVAETFQLEHSIAAVCDDRLVGIAGYSGSDGSLTGGIEYDVLLKQLGFFGGHRATLIFALYERKSRSGELLMDGISVHPDARGQGVGSRLLEAVAEHAAENGFDRIRLDVIDTNPRARQLYERRGFAAIRTEHFGYLRWLLGFGASTTMERRVDPIVKSTQ